MKIKINLFHLISVFITVFVLAILLLFPKQMLAASSSGLKLWFNVVLPSLFPFMVGVSLLSALGAADILGKIVEPVMKPVLNVPGCAAFALVMGILSGYPMGAKITQELLDGGNITTVQAQRVLSFSNNPGILFLLGTVATGMYQNQAAGYFLIAVAVLSALTTGILFRFYKPVLSSKSVPKRQKSTLSAQKPSGTAILGYSVRSSMDTIVQIGGFIILFSVMIEGMKLSGITDNIASFLLAFLPQNTPKAGVYGFLSGFLEMTNGANEIFASDILLRQKLTLTASVLCFGGLSILGQTISLVDWKRLKLSVYIISKLLTALFAACYCRLLYPFFEGAIDSHVPVFKLITPAPTNHFAFSVLILLLLALPVLFHRIHTGGRCEGTALHTDKKSGKIL